ncbi:MAG: T9SS type A sorting domain-containing protein [Bacteroidota bacterium]
MKRSIQLFLFFISSFFTVSAQTAVDFTANDCSGTSHHLFAELDAGKVIVVSFVEPCGSCIGPSLAAQSVVQGYAGSNPGRVLFYISDDIANTTCATLSSWASTNSMGGVPTFSDVSFRESDYGTISMPKIAVLAGTNHHVYFTQDNGLNTANLQTAINTAIAALSIVNMNPSSMEMTAYPNPAVKKLSLKYSLSETSDLTIEVYNCFGSKVYYEAKGAQLTGDHNLELDIDGNFNNGIYFLKLIAGISTATLRFIVNK